MNIMRSYGVANIPGNLPDEIYKTYTRYRAIEAFFLRKLIEDQSFCDSDRVDYAFSLIFCFAANQLMSRGSSKTMLSSNDSAHLICNNLTTSLLRSAKLIPYVPLVMTPLFLNEANVGSVDYKLALDLLTFMESEECNRRQLLIWKPIIESDLNHAIVYQRKGSRENAQAIDALPIGFLVFYMIGNSGRCMLILEKYFPLLSSCCTLMIYDNRQVVDECVASIGKLKLWQTCVVKTFEHGDAGSAENYGLALFQANFFPTSVRDDINHGLKNIIC